MICYKCGREQPDNAEFCKGCGTQLVRRPRVKSAGIADTLAGEVKIKDKTYKVWQVLVSLAAVCALLIIGVVLVKPVLNLFDNDAPVIVQPEKDTHKSDAKPIDAVSGVVIHCSVAMPELQSDSETAYDDGTWERTCVTTNNITMRFIRRSAEENWLNTHIFHYYPDVTNVEQFSESITVSGYSSPRIQFSSNAAPDCVIQAVCVSDGSFDHLFIVELPLVMFEEYTIYADEWFRRLELIDSVTGIESFNPALAASQSDTVINIE